LFYITLHICVQDTPGFIVNRLFVPYLAEAIRMVERGTVKPIFLRALYFANFVSLTSSRK